MTKLYLWQLEFIEYVRKLYLRKDDLETRVKKYIPGSLAVHTKSNGRRELYQHIYINGRLHQKYLSEKRDKSIIEELKRKKRELPVILKEISEVNKLYKKELPKALQILSGIRINSVNYPPSPSENPKYPEWLKYITSRGEKVRSISERIIADTLYRYGIDYRYEKSLVLSGVTIHPDFTIISPINGMVYYWEFNGLDTEEYRRSWHRKLALYAENNINIGENLIVSTQDDINRVEEIVREWFTLERYRGLLG